MLEPSRRRARLIVCVARARSLAVRCLMCTHVQKARLWGCVHVCTHATHVCTHGWYWAAVSSVCGRIMSHTCNGHDVGHTP